MIANTRFTDSAAADAWDRWFRWRDGDSVHDRTVDATWSRVATALAAAEGPQAQTWADRYVDAFSRWQLLPDERFLRLAGTGSELPAIEPCATLNVAAFVIAPMTRQARFDGERFVGTAALAVRLVDDALVTMHGVAATFADLRISLVGLADALHLLGIAYDETRAAEQTRAVGKALATGTLQGTTELAGERGPIDDCPRHRAALWRDRGTPETLIEDALSRGVRHNQLTAIEPRPRLALLSNNASDALDPAQPHRPPGSSEEPRNPIAGSSLDAEATISAQLAIRAAIQPWIDAPIDYPLAMCGKPDPQTIELYGRLAGAYGLPSFRRAYGYS